MVLGLIANVTTIRRPPAVLQQCIEGFTGGNKLTSLILQHGSGGQMVAKSLVGCLIGRVSTNSPRLLRLQFLPALLQGSDMFLIVVLMQSHEEDQRGWRDDAC